MALMLIAACSPSVATVAPGSLPYVTIDESIQGAKCSRIAAETIAVKRQQERHEAAKRHIECEGRVDEEEKKGAAYKAAAERGMWWQQYGLGMLIGGVIASLGLGFGIGYGAAK